MIFMIYNFRDFNKYTAGKIQHPQGLCYWYEGIIFVHWGIVVLVINLLRSSAIRGRSRALSSRPLFWLCRQLLGSFQRWTVFTTFILGYNHEPPTSTYFCLTTSAIWTGSHCRPAGSWIDLSTVFYTCWAQRIGGVSLLSVVICRTFPQP